MGLGKDIRKFGRSLEDGVRSLGSNIEDTVRNVGSKIDDKFNSVLDAALDDPLKAVATAAAIASGQWWALPTVNMVDAAIAGKPLNRILEIGAKTAAIQYITQEVSNYVGNSEAVQEFGKDVSNWLDGKEWGASVPINDIEAFANLGTNGMTNVAKAVVNGVANSAAAGITAALTGESITDAILKSAALGTAQTAIQAGALGNAIKYGPEYMQRALATSAAAGVLGESMTKGFTGSLLNSAIQYAGKKLEDTFKEQRPDLVRTVVDPRTGEKTTSLKDPMQDVKDANSRLTQAASLVNGYAGRYNELTAEAEDLQNEAKEFYDIVSNPDSYKTWIQNEYLAKGFPDSEGALNEYVQSKYNILVNNANAAARDANNFYNNTYVPQVDAFEAEQTALQDSISKAVEFDATLAAMAASDLSTYSNVATTLADIYDVDLDNPPSAQIIGGAYVTDPEYREYYENIKEIQKDIVGFLDSDTPLQDLYEYAIEVNPDFITDHLIEREKRINSGEELGFNSFDSFVMDKSGYNDVKELNPDFNIEDYIEINNLEDTANPFQHYLDVGFEKDYFANKDEIKNYFADLGYDMKDRDVDLFLAANERASPAGNAKDFVDIWADFQEENKGKYSEEQLEKEYKAYKEYGLTPQSALDATFYAQDKQQEQQQINNLKNLYPGYTGDWKDLNNISNKLDDARFELAYAKTQEQIDAAKEKLSEIESQYNQLLKDSSVDVETTAEPVSPEEYIQQILQSEQAKLDAKLAAEKSSNVTDKTITDIEATQPADTAESIAKETLPPVSEPPKDRTDELLQEIEKYQPQGYYPALSEEFAEIDYAAVDPNIPTPLGVETESTQFGKGLAAGVKGVQVGVPLTLSMAKDAAKAAGYQQQLDLYDLIDQGRSQEAYKIMGDNRVLARDVLKYESSTPEERAEARNLRMEAMKEVSASVLESARLYNQFRTEMNEKYKADVPELSDIRTSDIQTLKSDFGKWLAYNAGAGGASVAATMLGALVGGAPGAFAVGAALGTSESVGSRLQFLDNALKHLPLEQRADAIVKYLGDTQGTTLLTGATVGALDMLGPVGSLIRNRLSAEVIEQIATQSISKSLYQVPKEMLEEAFTGALQSMTQILGETYLDENPNDLLSMDTVKRVYNGAAAEAAGSLIGSGVNLSTNLGAKQWKEKTIEIANRHFIDEIQAGQPLYKDLLNPVNAQDAASATDALSKLEDSMSSRSVTKADLYGSSFPETPVNLDETLYKGNIVQVQKLTGDRTVYTTDNGFRILDDGNKNLTVFDTVSMQPVELSAQERQDLYETNISKYEPRPIVAGEVTVSRDEDNNLIYDIGSGYQAIEDSTGYITIVDKQTDTPVVLTGSELTKIYTDMLVPNKPAPGADIPLISTKPSVTEETKPADVTEPTKPVDNQKLADDLNKSVGTDLTGSDVDNLNKTDLGKDILSELGGDKVIDKKDVVSTDTGMITKPVDTSEVTKAADAADVITKPDVTDTSKKPADITEPVTKPDITNQDIANDINKNTGTTLTDSDVNNLNKTDLGRNILSELGGSAYLPGGPMYRPPTYAPPSGIPGGGYPGGPHGGFPPGYGIGRPTVPVQAPVTDASSAEVVGGGPGELLYDTTTPSVPSVPKIKTDQEIADDVNRINGTKLTDKDVKDLLSTDLGRNTLEVLGVDPYQINNRPAVDTKPTIVDTDPTVDTKPTIVDTKPTVVDTKPVVVDTKPVVVDTKPVDVDTKPVVVDTKPKVPDPPTFDPTVKPPFPPGPDIQPEPPSLEIEPPEEPPEEKPEEPITEVEPEPKEDVPPKPFTPKFNFPKFPTPQFPIGFLPYLTPGGIQSIINQPFYFNLPEEFDITRAFSPTLYEEMSEEE